MGASVTGQLTLAETQFLGTQARAMGSIGQPNAATGKFNFFAGFDGTLNDRNNVPDGEHQTNIGNLYQQAFDAAQTNGNLTTGYYPGIGTGGVAGNLWDAALSPTQEVYAIANVAYNDFQKAARDYL